MEPDLWLRLKDNWIFETKREETMMISKKVILFLVGISLTLLISTTVAAQIT